MMDSWQRQAGCLGRDPNLWFSHDPTDQAQARRICLTECPVKDACLDYALATNTDRGDCGIWGGTDAPQRRQLRAGPNARPTRPAPATDPERVVPMVEVARQPDGVFVDATGHITIVAVERRPGWVAIVDDRVVARCDTLDDARAAAWRAIVEGEVAVEAVA